MVDGSNLIITAIFFFTSKTTPWLTHSQPIIHTFTSKIEDYIQQMNLFHHRDNILYLSANVPRKLSMSKQFDSRYKQLNKYSMIFLSVLKRRM